MRCAKLSYALTWLRCCVLVTTNVDPVLAAMIGEGRFKTWSALICVADIEECLVPGHWEEQSEWYGHIKGAGNRSQIGTLVERNTRYVARVMLCSDTVQDYSRLSHDTVRFVWTCRKIARPRSP